jgi:hypothetical protein
MIPPHPGLGRHLRRLLDPLLRTAAAVPGADRYRKHFSTLSHLQILLFHVLDGSSSLRQTHAKLSGLGFETVGLAQPISRSQLARSSTSRPLAPVAHLFADLARLAQARTAPGEWDRVRLIDVRSWRSAPPVRPGAATAAMFPACASTRVSIWPKRFPVRCA